MEKRTYYFSLPLFGNQFFGNCFNMSQFSAKIQIYCRKFGIDDYSSLALIVAGTSKEEEYFLKSENVYEVAKEAYKKLPKDSGPVDVTDVTSE